MHVSRLYIENFRSIKQIDLKFMPNKNIIIGKNNSGKSNIMRAIDLMLGEKSPTYANSENITEDDFFCYDDIHANEIYIWMELDRANDPIEEFDYDLLYSTFGYYIYTQYRSQNSPLRIPVESRPSQYKPIFDIDPDSDEVNKFYVNPKIRNQGKIEEQIENKFKFAFAFRAVKDNDGRIKKEMRLLYREGNDEDGGWVLAFKDSIRTELLQSAIVPAFRDPATQLRLNNWSWFGRLMKSLTESHSHDQQLKDALDNVKSVSNVVFDEVQQKINASSIDIAFPGATVSFQFSGDANRELYKSTRIFVDDGFKSELERKGTGIQSATVIGLFNYYVNVVSAKSGAILCVEEPELYLHPHAKRVLSDRLDDFIDAREGIKNQVVITTHSTEFIRSQKEGINIIRIARDEDTTRTWSMTSHQTKKFVINPSQAELVFADKVIICEGYDKGLLDCLGDKLEPQALDAKNISVIRTNSKDQLASTVKFAYALGITPIVLADFDYLLRDKLSQRNTYNALAHDSVEQIGATPLKMMGDTNGSLFARIQSLRVEIKQDQEMLFYKAKELSEFSEGDLRAKIETLLTDLGAIGVFILPTEIEGQFLDRSLLDGGKCSDETIRKVRELEAAELPTIITLDTLKPCIDYALA